MNKTERQINLVFLLMSTKRGLTRAQIRNGIFDYREATSDQSFERMFERDKQEMKELGFHLESFQDLFAASDEIYYRIVREDSIFHTSNLSVQQKILFQVARMQMQETIESSRKTLIKLETLPSLEHIELSLKSNFEQSNILQNLIQGIDQRRAVSFDYMSSEDDSHQRRDVVPIRIIFWNRKLYLIAYSRAKESYRTYRIDKISGPVDLGEIVNLDMRSEGTEEFKEFILRLDSLLGCRVTMKKSEIFRFPENTSLRMKVLNDSIEISYSEREIDELFRVLLRNIENIENIEPEDLSSKFKQHLNRINHVQF